MPETTPRRKPNARLSRWVRNKLPWPHSCISAKARNVNKLISNTGATVSQGETSTLNTSTHQRSARYAKVVKTCVNPLTLSDWACPRMMARFCSFMWRIDDTIRHLGVLFIICGKPQGRSLAPNVSAGYRVGDTSLVATENLLRGDGMR